VRDILRDLSDSSGVILSLTFAAVCACGVIIGLGFGVASCTRYLFTGSP
jgi:hypothetical protein